MSGLQFRKWLSAIVVLGLSVLISANSAAGAAGQARLSQPRQLTLTYDITVQSNGQVATLDLELPLFSGAPSEFQSVIEMKATPPGRIRRTGTDNYTAVAHWDNLNQYSSVRLKVVVTLQHYRAQYRINPAQCSGDYGRWPELAPYLRAEPGIESSSDAIRECAARVVGQATNPYEKSRLLFAFVNDHMEYDLAAETGLGALAALRNARGVCGDYADLFVALCRATGIPARKVYGFRYDLKKDGDLKTPRIVNDQHHAWAEVFLTGYQWVPIDPTFTYTLNGKKTVNYDYYGGFPADDLHIAVGPVNPEMAWNYQYYGRQPSVRAELTETLCQVSP